MGKLSLEQRVTRILGQVKGVEKMVKEKRNQVEILQQVTAVKKAIDGLSREIIIDYFHDKVQDSNKEEVATVIQRIIDL